VAALPPREQKEWLKKAEDERMSHHQLRDLLKPEPVARVVCGECGRPI
jgi:hypothetical protein